MDSNISLAFDVLQEEKEQLGQNYWKEENNWKALDLLINMTKK